MLEVDVGSETLPLSPGHLRGLLRHTVYSARGAAAVPWLVERLEARRLPSSLLRPVVEGLDDLAVEPLLSVFCAEDLPLARSLADPDPAAVEARRALERICRTWSVTPDPEVLAVSPIDTPALVLSGGADPATPSDIAARAESYLHGARFVTTPGLGHFPTWTSCFAALAAAHAGGGAPETLDAACAEEDGWEPWLFESPGERLARIGGIAALVLGALGTVLVVGRRARRV
jgi:pimeloyl-ACP methyl ester carboxylesterase